MEKIRIEDQIKGKEASLKQAEYLALLQEIAEARSHAAFDKLFRQIETPAYSLAYHLCRNSVLAEEALQEAMVRVWRYADRCHELNPRAWILKIVANQTLQLMQKAAKENKRNTSDTLQSQMKNDAQRKNSDNEVTEHNELHQALYRSLDQLPDHGRQIVALSFGANLSQTEIGKILKIPQSTVSLKLGEALAKLRSNLITSGFAATVPLLEAETFGPLIMSAKSTPPQLHDQIMDAISGFNKNATQPTVATKSATMTWIMAPVCIVAIIGLGWGALHQSQPAPQAHPEKVESLHASASDSTTTNSPKRVFKTSVWNFDKEPDSRKDFKIVIGKWRWLPKSGQDHSGCMETNGNFVAELDLPTLKLPILITFRSFIIPPPTSAGYLSHFQPRTATRKARFRNIGKPHLQTINANVWVTSSIYLTENYTDTWTGGHRASFNVYEGFKSDGKYHIAMAGHQRIDNFSVQEISLKELPDVHAYLDAFENIPMADRKGKVKLPTLKSGKPGKQVEIEFYSYPKTNK